MFNDLIAERGWDESSLCQMLLEFIGNQKLNFELLKFLEEKAEFERENEIKFNEDLNL